MDNNLAASQRAIGESSNLAQIALTYMYNFDDQKYIDYVCILSVLAQVSIDSAKRRFDVDITNEIKRIKQDMNVRTFGYPAFWGVVKKGFNKDNIDSSLTCPMNYLCSQKFEKHWSKDSTLPMSAFFIKYEQDDRRKCRKVEDLIQKYSLELYRAHSSDGEEDYLLERADFDTMIEDIRKVYLSRNYLGLMSWLIDRAFCITNYQRAKQRIGLTNTTLDKNRVVLMKTLYTINPKLFLKVFAKNVP